MIVSRPSFERASAATAVALLLSACCPDPRQADAGAVSELGIGAAGASFSSIQREIFDRHCVKDCHEGASAGASLQLSRGRSHASLVNVRSQQIASQIRVVPGDPARSYLVKKLAGGIGIVGDQMPKLAPLRPTSEVDAVRSWIARGAPDD